MTRTLTAQEKLALATQIFNSTLTTMTDAVKARAAKATSGNLQLTRSPSSTQALSAISPNKRDASPAKSSKAQPKASRRVSSTGASGLIAVAESARLALGCLRMLQGKKEGGNETSRNMQLEQGMTVLTGKLVALGLHEQAVGELRILKRRIDASIGASEKTVPAKSTTKTKTKPSPQLPVKESIADLLKLEAVPKDNAVLSLFITAAQQVLRIIAVDKRPSTIQNAVPYIDPKNATSLPQLILEAHKRQLFSADKASQQLQLFGQTLFSLCPSIASLEDATAASELGPRTAFTIQSFALMVRPMWWNLSGHMADVNKELWEPFARCLSALSRRSQNIDKAVYVHAKTQFEQFQKLMSITGLNGPSKSTNSTILKLLGQLAQACGRTEDALEAFTDSMATMSLKDSDSVTSALHLCKMAHLQLQKSASGRTDAATDALTLAAEGLTHAAKGSSSDLDELLLEAGRLKKAVMSALSKTVDAAKAGSQEEAPDAFSAACIGFVYAFVPFLRRYIGTPPASKGDEDAERSQRYERRLRNAGNVARIAIDSATSAANVSLIYGGAEWPQTDNCLSECVALLRVVNTKSDDGKTSAGTIYVKLSNVYWSRYLKQRGSDAPKKELLNVLLSSTKILAGASIEEKRIGFAGIKYERLAAVYLELGLGEKAQGALYQCIQTHVDTGLLSQAAVAANTRSFSSVWNDGKSDWFILSRVVSAFIKLAQKNGEKVAPAYIDFSNLAGEERGLLLELQLSIMLELSANEAGAAYYRQSLQSLVSALLALYSLDQYPLRRLRTLLALIRPTTTTASSIQDLIDADDVQRTIEIVSGDDLSSDSGLTAFAKSLIASVQLANALSQDQFPEAELKSCVTSWDELTQGCDTWSVLEAQVENPNRLMQDVKAILPYLEMQGAHKSLISAQHSLLRLTELRDKASSSNLVEQLADTGLQYARLGYSHKAGQYFARGKQLLEASVIEPLSSLQWHLSYAEYLISIGGLDKANEILSQASAVYQGSQDPEKALSLRSRLSLETLTARAAYLQSLAFFEEGNIDQAYALSKMSVKSNGRVWASLEKLHGPRKPHTTPDTTPANSSDESDSLVAEMSAVSTIDDDDQSMHGSAFWPYLVPHCSGLLNLSKLSAHNGLFQDAVYYAEQALRCAEAVGAELIVARAQSLLGDHHSRAGHIEEGSELANQAISTMTALGSSIDLVSAHWSRRQLPLQEDDEEEEAEDAAEVDDNETALMVLSELSKEQFKCAFDFGFDDSTLSTAMAGLAISTSAAPTRGGKRSKAPTKAAAKLPARSRAKPKVAPPAAEESVTFLRMKANILRKQAFECLLRHEVEEAGDLLATAAELPATTHGSVDQHILHAEQLLASSIKSLTAHAVYCVLPESTISFPSVIDSEAQQKRDSASQAASTSRKPSAAASKRAKATPATEVFIEKLIAARESLAQAQSFAMGSGSTRYGHHVSNLLSRITLFLSSTASRTSCLQVSPLHAAFATELGRTTAAVRESRVIAIDKQKYESHGMPPWPEWTGFDVETGVSDVASFQKDYIDIIPTEWTVISISVSDDQSEFLVSKLHAGRKPFLVRLPLKRLSSEDAEEEEFTLQQGKQELLEIVEMANTTAHNARERTDKKAKAEWWEEREALDQRLGELLANMENVWLGGFRGVFSQKNRDSRLLGSFSQSFHGVLDKHLPSRRKQGKGKQTKVNVYTKVLELFVGLKEGMEADELENCLVDLLYFVVDILQFHGERNAYDEIDFDMMVLDTMDALNRYHEQVRQQAVDESSTHTILILERSLHAFPWESMPCLRGASVSRMPSLGALRDRILTQRQRCPGFTEGLQIDRQRGSCILNPSGDLKSTEETFSKVLANLPTWSSIVHAPPSESEFQSILSTKDLFLYFGHGSGAQYIRGRSIKRLDTCAVTFLMGCSSGTLTETGDFEPYGTPLNYIQAGCPALVATLWDVTDKDIDRFALGTFRHWGLSAEESEKETSSVKAKGKGRARKGGAVSPTQPQATGVGLDEAVARAREECVLKYLNGAAPVVYGIPVFVK